MSILTRKYSDIYTKNVLHGRVSIVWVSVMGWDMSLTERELKVWDEKGIYSLIKGLNVIKI